VLIAANVNVKNVSNLFVAFGSIATAPFSARDDVCSLWSKSEALCHRRACVACGLVAEFPLLIPRCFMKTPKQGQPSERAAEDCRRKARDAERAANAAQTAEDKQYHLEIAKHWWELADRVERGD
jgi:hypothetical protein